MDGSRENSGTDAGAPTLGETVLREIFHSVNDVIFVHDAETGRIIDVNESVSELYGYSRAEVRSLTVEDLSSGVPPYTQDTAVEHVREAARGEPQVFDWQAADSDGNHFWVEVSMRRATVEGETLVLVIVRDVTDRKRRERDLERQNDRLDEFASIVSHDLRNPLNVAEGHLELARETGETDHLDAVVRAHERMGTLIDDLLALARNGGMPTRTSSVDLAERAAAAWRSVETGEATLVADVDHTIRADPDCLLQLFENLFRNSVEHGSTESRPEADDLTVRVGVLDGGFYVEDDGVGIPPADRERVFESSFSTAAGGTGLGLRIVEEIADAHGWSVAATDGPDGGARFEVTGVEAVED